MNKALLKYLWTKIWLYANKLELSTPLLELSSTSTSFSLRVLKVLTALSLAIQMARVWRWTELSRRWPAGRLRQLGVFRRQALACGLESPFIFTLPLWTCVCSLINRSTIRVIWIMWFQFVRLMVCNEWWLWYLTIMPRNNNIPGIAMYDIIGIRT